MRWSRFFRRRRRDDELSREIEAYVAIEIDQNIARGMTSEEARFAALRKFGNARRVREEVHSMNSLGFLETLWQDLKFAARMLRKSPGFAAITILTLALGIGANTAIFSIVNAVFLRPLPFPHSDRIYVVRRVGNQFGGVSISMPIYLAWRPQASMFEHLSIIHWHDDASFAGAGEPERILSTSVSSEFLPAIGIQPAMGRNFSPDEERTGGPNAVIVTDQFWRDHLGADPAAVGREIILDGEGYAVAGILPRGLEIPIPEVHSAQILFPLQIPLTSQDPSNSGTLAIGLLKPGANPEQAAATLTPPLQQLRASFPKMFMAGEKVQLVPLRGLLRDWAGPAPLLLLGAVGLVLLIACANVANLSLARSTARQREMAIRVTMGAGRRRIARQLLTESLLLGLLGGAVGVVACYASFQSIISLVPTDEAMPHIGAYQIDGTVLGFALLLSLATGVIFGLVPAIGAGRVDLNIALQESGPRAGSGQGGRLRAGLAVGEIAISVVLLIGAAITLESLAGLVHVKPGFDTSNVTTAAYVLPVKQYDTITKRREFVAQGIERLAALPGVEGAAMIDQIPFHQGSDILIDIEGRPVNPNEIVGAEIRGISPSFFNTLRIPLLRGRSFSDADNVNSQPVVIINHAMADAYWPKGNALGAHIWIGRPMGPRFTEPAAREVVGIVGDIHEMSLAQPPEPSMYIPLEQSGYTEAGYFLVRSASAGGDTASAVRNTLLKLDPNNPPTKISSMEHEMTASLTDWRFRAILLGVFGALALVIATIGIYGVISYSVAQRTREIGIRVALGAKREDVLRLILGQGARIALVGVTIGLIATTWLAHLLASTLYGIPDEQPAMLYGIRATDPLPLMATSLLLLLVTLFACYVPARRAMRVDPMIALRYE